MITPVWGSLVRHGKVIYWAHSAEGMYKEFDNSEDRDAWLNAVDSTFDA